MTDSGSYISLIGIVGALAVVVFVLMRGQWLKKIKIGQFEAELGEPSRSSHAIVLVTEVPERMGWLELSAELNGERIGKIKAKDKAGRYVAQKRSVKTDGPAFYSIEARGVQRVFDAKGHMETIDYSGSGDGQLNVVHGGIYVLWETMELGPGGARSEWYMDSRENYEASQLPDDIAMIEIDKLINAA